MLSPRTLLPLTLLALAWPIAAQAQLPLPGSAPAKSNPLADATLTNGKMLLLDLEARFARDVAARGGEAFAEWFAPDGVALGNGQPAQQGREAIARASRWSPKDYQLSWTPTEAVLGPSGDIGYTWGRFEGRSKDANGYPVVTTGRYIAIWRKQANGDWKVALDAGANEPPPADDCCRLPGAH